ncbi:Mg-chelatase subunits D/I family, ComM subfamily protein [Kutzneria sp. 744]|nr:Mg-chelatase subunits D/I family, ComM subfamily protein [Kutzneria sp. 744]
MLAATWLHQLLPDLTPAQQREVAALQSLTGPPEDGAILVSTPPMATAHHSISLAALIGGGVPGAVSQAHHGLLVAGELDQFTTAALGSLRVTLLARETTLIHGGHERRFPANFQLFATCVRTSALRRPRLAPGLLDAIDIHLTLGASACVMNQHPSTAAQQRAGQLLTQARTRVAAARARSAARWNPGARALSGAGTALTNAAVPTERLHTVPMPGELAAPVCQARDAGALSRRGAEAVWRLAWTIADLDGAKRPDLGHVEQALALRRADGTRPAGSQVR